MKFLSWRKDGGPESHVTGFFLIEIKSLFSIVLLRFAEGSRDAYHTHAFNAWTWFIKGYVTEHIHGKRDRHWFPSFKPKYTPRACFHKVFAHETTWALSFRGPWSKHWVEYRPATQELVKLGNGRKVLETRKV